MTDRKSKVPKCGAKNRAGNPCGRPSGWGTDHFGEGRCKLHGGAIPIKTGRYSKIKRRRIAELIEHYRQESDPLDIVQELHLLRALVTDFVERYDEMTDAILAWHNSYGDSYQQAMKDWHKAAEKQFSAYQEQCVRAMEQPHEFEELPKPPRLPPLPMPNDHQGKPRQILDIISVGKFIGEIGRMVERIEKIGQDGTVSLAALDRYLEHLGVEVVEAARKVIADESERTQLLSEISDRWQIVRLDDPGAGARTSQGTRGLAN